MVAKAITENHGRTAVWQRTIYGQAYSKANSRQLIFRNGKPVFIKSKEALRYSDDFLRQCPQLSPIFTCDVCVELDMYYASRRPDLDESLVLDLLQGKVYENDRLVRRKVVQWYLDKDNPRVSITVYPIAGEDRSSE